VTEDEAKTKACCAAVRGGNERGMLKLKAPPCIASACMAWRETPDPTKGRHDEEREIYREQNGRHRPGGFCGLAGAPQ